MMTLNHGTYWGEPEKRSSALVRIRHLIQFGLPDCLRVAANRLKQWFDPTATPKKHRRRKKYYIS